MQPSVPEGAEPAVTAAAAWSAVVDAVLAELASVPGALLPILHAIQERLGYVPPAAVPSIARALNLSQAEVHGVITFYHDFRSKPPGRHVLKLCRAESCQAMGCERLEQRLQQQHGISMHETSADGRLTVEPVYCLGNCALSPALLLDGELQGRVSEQRLDELLRGLLPKGAGA
jgi:formate dehydrogenase subunit gamma